MLQHSGYIKFKNRFCVPVQVQMYQTANFTKLKIESPSQANRGGSDLQICSQMPVEATSPWTWGQWPSALHGVPVQLPAYTVPISTAWWQRKQGVSNLPKVFTQQRPGQELNTHSTSTVLMPYHLCQCHPKLYKSSPTTLLTWNSKLCWPLSESRCFVTLYPGLPIFTNRLMSTRGFSGAGCAGASLASLAALCALYPPCRM